MGPLNHCEADVRLTLIISRIPAVLPVVRPFLFVALELSQYRFPFVEDVCNSLPIL